MNRFRLISAAIVAALVGASTAGWFLHRAPSRQQPSVASTEASPASPRTALEKNMVRWLLREGRRHLRNHRLQAAAGIAEAVFFFAGDEGALPLRAALEQKRTALTAEWRVLSRDAVEAGDRAEKDRFDKLLEEADELEAAGAADLR